MLIELPMELDEPDEIFDGPALEDTIPSSGWKVLVDLGEKVRDESGREGRRRGELSRRKHETQAHSHFATIFPFLRPC